MLNALRTTALSGADQHGGEDEPGDPAADELGDAIDQARQGEQGRHGISVGRGFEASRTCRREAPPNVSARDDVTTPVVCRSGNS